MEQRIFLLLDIMTVLPLCHAISANCTSYAWITLIVAPGKFDSDMTQSLPTVQLTNSPSLPQIPS